MVKIVFVSLLGLAAAGGKLALTWEDCGDASTHGTTTDLQPSEIVIGQDTDMIGTGTTDKTISSGSFTMQLSASMGIKETYTGKICEAKQFKMPLNLGTVSWAGMTCPVAVGPSTVKVGVKMAASLPAALAKADLTLTAKDQDGEPAVCVKTHLKKEQLEARTQPSFEDWAAEHGMNGDDVMKTNYEANVRIIDELNARDSSAIYAVNKFSAMTHDEFAAIYLNYKQHSSTELPALEVAASAALDDAVDWDVTPVKDQGQCGSCWTFGVMGAIEGLNKVVTGKEVILSEQQLVDCDKDGINDGCNGGLTDYAFKYLTGKDLYTSASYPYVSGKSGHANSCQTGARSGVSISGYFTVDGAGSGSRGDAALATALMTGPVTITVAADNQFANYHSGIMTGVPTACNLNHAILATGYGPNFWKIKNSWGSSWGDEGFAKFERSTSGCGPFGIFFQDAGFQPKLSSSHLLV